MTRQPATRARLLAVATLCAAGLAILALTPSSPAGRPGTAPAWRWLWPVPTRSADPIEALTATSRLIAMAALVYLVLITIANLAQSFVPDHRRGSRPWRALQSLTPRWLAMASIGVAIGAGPVAAQQPLEPTDGRAAPVMELLDAGRHHGSSGSTPPPSTAGPTEQGPALDPGSAVGTGGDVEPGSAVATGATDGPDGGPVSSMPWADDDADPMIDPSSPLQPIPDQSTALEATEPDASSAAAAPATQPSVDQLPPSVAVYRVQPGDHFWSIAEQVVTQRDGPGAPDAVVAAYWRQLIDANRDRLVDPDNPDLIMPGQVFDLPW